MDDARFRDFVLELAGPSRDRARLARLLGVSESTAYGWIRLSEQGQLRMNTAVRGDQNKHAKEALLDAAAEVERGTLQMGDVERFLKERLPVSPLVQIAATEPPLDESARKASLRKGLQYVMRRFDEDSTADELIAAIEAVVAMNKER